MRKRFLIIVLVFFLVPSFKAEGYKHSEKTLEKAKKALGKIWDDHEVGLEAVSFDPASSYFSPYDTLFRLVDDTSILGYLVVSAAKGRFELFDFMMIYTSELEVVEVRVLVYRSEFGSQVSSKGWLKQFYGFPPEEGIQYGSQIDALSGATFSAKSLTSNVNRLNGLMAERAGKK
jgi:hypothetical protein